MLSVSVISVRITGVTYKTAVSQSIYVVCISIKFPENANTTGPRVTHADSLTPDAGNLIKEPSFKESFVNTHISS